jgi:adenylate cyclase
MTRTRQLAAIMFTDIVGYTALMGNDEERAIAFLSSNRELQRPIIEQFNGSWIKELGDGVLASFKTVSDAVNAAVKIQEACNNAGQYQLRIGVHQGEVLFEEDDIFGDAVNIAARIQTAAKAGSIYVSESVHQNVFNKKDITTKFVKEEILKNVKEPVKMYEVVMNGSTALPVETEIKVIPRNSIAVLPFTNMSSDPEQEYFSDGISEEIINMLAQVAGLKVAGRISSFTFKGKNQDLRLIGTQLNVDHILEGSVRKSGEKLRITAELVNVADGYQVWSQKFDRELKDIFEIQDEISLAILKAIKIKLFGSEKEAVLKRYTDNAEAYHLYLQGRFYYNKWAGAEGFNKAIEYFRAAIKIEPDYAIAYTGIASCYLNLWIFSHLPPEQSLPQMKEAAEKSLLLDDKIAESHLTMARIKMYYEWDLSGAAHEFEKALELNSNIAEIHEQYAYCLGLTGLYPDALKHAAIAFQMEPFSLMNNNHIGLIYWMAGEYEKAIGQGRRLVELEPNFYGGHFLLGLILASLQKFEEAIPEAEIAVNQNYGTFTLSLLGLIYGAIGEKARASEVLKKMEDLRNTNAGSCYDLALVNAALGNYDTALDLFEKGLERHEGLMLYLKYSIRSFPGIEQDRRVEALLEKIGVPYK